ncbi:hypothetical protein LXL04_033014 [Taraxacum kok-saghyz]
MAKKKNENNNNNNNEKDDSSGKKQKASGGVTVVVLKMDLHCEGCAGRVVKAVRTLDGVESVRIGDSELNKITVIGSLDPAILRKKVEEKTKKKVELISPATKKNNDGENNNGGGGGGGDNKKKQQKPPQENQQPPSDNAKNAVKKDEKKPKEIPVTTAVLKVPLHCQGCVRKIQKVVSKTKGYMDMSIDMNKDFVTVKGAIDMKILAEVLKQKLKRAVEIVQPKKDGGDGGGDKKGKGGGDKKGKGGGGGNDGDEKGGGGGGGEKKGKKGGGGDEGDEYDGKTEAYKMESFGGSIGYPYPHFAYGSGYADLVHAPQLFSDENPNACSVM